MSGSVNTPFFWDVDTQVDFIHPSGKLYVPDAEKIVPNLKRLTSWASRQGILVIASVDAHREGDAEFEQYPPHCLMGTPGQNKIPDTLLPNHYVIPNRKVDLPDGLFGFQQLIIEKQHFDVFTNPNVDSLLRQLGKDHEIVLYGVVTEICVDHAAQGLLDYGFRVHLVTDAIMHLDEAKGRAAREKIQQRGGNVTITDQVIA